MIDAMAMAKLNTLHWHLTDDESFAPAAPSHPELPHLGAFSPGERYTPSDLRRVVEHARARGVRVVPEFDMPGHSASWSKAHPEVFATGRGCRPASGSGPAALDPANNKTFSLIEELLRDWASIFTDRVVHLGGDEVAEECWENPSDRAFMARLGLTETSQLFGF